MGALRRDIASRPAPVRVDAIFVTGDIAFSGAGRSDKEYDLARRVAARSRRGGGVKPDRIFLVPGNHDVNRNVDSKSKSTGRLVKALRSRATPDQALDDALRDPDDRKLLAGRMERLPGLRQGLRALGGAEPATARRGAPLLGPRARRPGRPARAPRRAQHARSCARTTEDQGQLPAGQGADRPGPPRRPPAERTGDRRLSHHPLRKGWLGDEGHADAWIRNHAHAHLSGHVHEAESEGALGLRGSFVRVTAGAAHNDQLPARIPADARLQLRARVRRGSRAEAMLRIYPRHWSSSKTRFVLDVHSVPDGEPANELRADVRRARAACHAPRPGARSASPQPPGGQPASLTIARARRSVRSRRSRRRRETLRRDRPRSHLLLLRARGRAVRERAPEAPRDHAEAATGYQLAASGARSVGAGGEWQGRSIDRRLSRRRT